MLLCLPHEKESLLCTASLNLDVNQHFVTELRDKCHKNWDLNRTVKLLHLSTEQ